ncbi:unnamed protein product [Protopolystoma xenopodis]|uniref:Guanylate kinase-like domain-containing protein n=1 Tax=Protopolystoma xenopodis TaxID=117903 RepID=A0A3S5FGU2_9PLAT|nr:unnamed protein product [Protopolystoma xenopodis]
MMAKRLRMHHVHGPTLEMVMHTMDSELAPESITADDPVAWLDREVAVGRLYRFPSLLTFEPVVQYYPEPSRRRPLVLLGPAHVGRHQLLTQMVRSDPHRFVPAVIRMWMTLQSNILHTAITFFT